MRTGRTEAGMAAKPLQLRLTLLTRRGSRTLVLPPSAIAVFLGLVPVAVLLFIATGGYFIFHDDLLAGLTQRQIAMQYSYEDQVGRLRHEVTNLTQHAKINEAELAERLGTLAQQQSQLESQTTLVADLAERATALHGTPRASAPAASRTGPNPLLLGGFAPKLPSAVSAYAPQSSINAPTANLGEQKPQPEGFDLRLEDRAAAAAHSKAQEPSASVPAHPGANGVSLSPLSFDFDLPLTTRLDRLAARQAGLDHQQLALLSDLQKPAASAARRFRAAFDAAGLVPDQLSGAPAGKGATGGPFVPLPMTSPESAAFARAATQAQAAIASAEKLRQLASYVPFAAPLPGRMEVTSPFGARMDPFLGRPALHTGVDLRQDFGAPVRATAAGIVAFAGSDGGYGNMIQIDHGNGLSTRYAHLSSLSVLKGQKVETGAIVGRIGETGRATGPHLHYETRIDGVPVNPERFLKAGLMLRTASAETEL